jgi:glycosyltransferase involved in cell wall biosynthesis
VVAYARGGSADTVVPGVTGALVEEQTPAAFAEGLRTVLDGRLDPAACRRNAERFAADRFADDFVSWVLGSARARGIELDDPRATEPV